MKRLKESLQVQDPAQDLVQTQAQVLDRVAVAQGQVVMKLKQRI